MLPATLLSPAVRPFFHGLHGGSESAMHAFMSVNMIGAVAAAWLLGRSPSLRALAERRLSLLVALDATSLLAIGVASSVAQVLALRAIEGALHVGVASLLLSRVAARGRAHDEPRVVPAAGAAVVFAIALGSSLGGLVVSAGARAPMLLAGILLLVVATIVPRGDVAPSPTRPDGARAVADERPLCWQLVAGAFVTRFTVGCLVVSFSLFAHRVHALSDRQIGFLYSALTLPFALATYPAGALGRRWPRAILLFGGGAGTALGFGVLGAVPTPALGVTMAILGVASALVFSALVGYAAARPEPVRPRAFIALNGAGCAGMLCGPIAAGIVCAVGRVPHDPSRGYRAAFLLAAASALGWLLAASPWLLRQAAAERATKGRAPALDWVRTAA
jgi:MFS family permease